ncbi:MAG TPA: serine protease [Hyphomicrobiaceae bacterium]|nr:serine protease [Hyphomicrobiaceae bacterium]
MTGPRRMSGMVAKLTIAGILGATASAILQADTAAAQGEVIMRKRLPMEIVGGTPTRNDQHPWQIALMFVRDGQLRQFCGGSLVAPNWVLTAAHCVTADNEFKETDGHIPAEVMRVMTGATNVVARDGEVHEVEAVHVHSDYRVPNAPIADLLRTVDRAGANVNRNDIALIKLKTAATRGRPIALAPDDHSLNPGAMVEITGWGDTREGGRASAVLLRAQVPYVAYDTCNGTAMYSGRLAEGMICAGLAVGGTDTCQGDSGGPMVHHSDRGAVLVGVTSWGQGCARANRPGVYSSVTHFRAWITSTMTFQ